MAFMYKIECDKKKNLLGTIFQDTQRILIEESMLFQT